MDKLILIDGHALVFKMYYAFLRRPMVNSKGADMSILYGFTKYLLELIEKEKPTHLAVAFDPPGGTFRNQLYPEYKGTRHAMPEELKEQVPIIKGDAKSVSIAAASIIAITLFFCIFIPPFEKRFFIYFSISYCSVQRFGILRILYKKPASYIQIIYSFCRKAYL